MKGTDYCESHFLQFNDGTKYCNSSSLKWPIDEVSTNGQMRIRFRTLVRQGKGYNHIHLKIISTEKAGSLYAIDIIIKRHHKNFFLQIYVVCHNGQNFRCVPESF